MQAEAPQFCYGQQELYCVCMVLRVSQCSVKALSACLLATSALKCGVLLPSESGIFCTSCKFADPGLNLGLSSQVVVQDLPQLSVCSEV